MGGRREGIFSYLASGFLLVQKTSSIHLPIRILAVKSINNVKKPEETHVTQAFPRSSVSISSPEAESAESFYQVGNVHNAQTHKTN